MANAMNSLLYTVHLRPALTLDTHPLIPYSTNAQRTARYASLRFTGRITASTAPIAAIEPANHTTPVNPYGS